MIIAILEDGGVMVHDDLGDVLREHEGIDVENEAVKFHDSSGSRLRVVFTEPNIRSTFVVASGQFHLEPAGHVKGELAAALAGAAYLEPSSAFSSLQELRDQLSAHRDRGV